MTWLRDERGQDLIEYGLLAALISTALVAAVLTLGDAVGNLWTQISDVMTDVTS